MHKAPFDLLQCQRMLLRSLREVLEAVGCDCRSSKSGFTISVSANVCFERVL